MKVIKVGTELHDVSVVEWDGSLKQLQEMVDGYIEVVQLIDFEHYNIKMIVNEEGLLKGLPVNDNLLPYFYVGNAVFVGQTDEDLIGLTQHEINYVLACLSRTDEP